MSGYLEFIYRLQVITTKRVFGSEVGLLGVRCEWAMSKWGKYILEVLEVIVFTFGFKFWILCLNLISSCNDALGVCVMGQNMCAKPPTVFFHYNIPFKLYFQ